MNDIECYVYVIILNSLQCFVNCYFTIVIIFSGHIEIINVMYFKQVYKNN